MSGGIQEWRELWLESKAYKGQWKKVKGVMEGGGMGWGRGGGKSGRKVYIRVGKYPQVQYL
jgi:hypothetical protein